MKDEKIENLLKKLSQKWTEPAQPELAEKIKDHIPKEFDRHHTRAGTIRIIIDLKVGKLAAAAVIAATIGIAALFYGQFDSGRASILQDGKTVLRYLFTSSAAQKQVISGIEQSSSFFRDGREIVYYGDSDDSNDTIMMHWKLSDDSYRVIFGDFSTEVLSTEELINLQAKMIQKKTE